MTTIRIPDIGDASNVTVIEVAVSQGDTVAEGDTLIVLESDKASMEIPADASGVVGKIHVSEGAEVNEGDPICELEGAESGAETVTEASNAISACRTCRSRGKWCFTVGVSSRHRQCGWRDSH